MEATFEVMYRTIKRPRAKVKWEGDGQLVMKNNQLVLYDGSAELCRKHYSKDLDPDTEIVIGKYIVLVGSKTLVKTVIKQTPLVNEFDIETIMKPHQIEALTFLQDCILGKRNKNQFGAVLADEMGLGKSLVAIGVIWNLYKQCKQSRFLLVCPASLIDHWRNEFKKWLQDRIKIYPVNSASEIKDFVIGRIYNVMIIGYEKLVIVEELLKLKFELLICDEGHRLKSAKLVITAALSRLKIQKRIIITGTPIQNNLSEYYNVMDFVNPGILGTYSEFRQNIELPIQENSSQALETISRINENFMIKRTFQDIEFSGEKSISRVYLKATKEQNQLYMRALDECRADLSLISKLKAISSAPEAFGAKSAKLEFVENLVQQSLEKIVVVSHYTSTLNVLEKSNILINAGISRIDGSTPVAKRQGIIDSFAKKGRVFLLSAKAGGLGLNLSCASRIVMYDVDWNPAVEEQAMARVWRHGQKSKVYEYRLILEGSIEELIEQRQQMKRDLCELVIPDLEKLAKKL